MDLLAVMENLSLVALSPKWVPCLWLEEPLLCPLTSAPCELFLCPWKQIALNFKAS